MLVKLVPEDFVVEELSEWTPADRGAFSIYEVTKRKLDTFEAVRLVSVHARVPLQKVAYVGLKDRQGVTTQLVSVEGGRLDGRIPGLRYRYLGRAKAPLGPEQLRGNAFTIVVRDLGDDDVALLPGRRARLERHGLIDYFDDQRFGSLVAGQGLPGRDLVRGDHEAVVRALIATPGRRDPVPEKKFKVLVSRAWGDWDLICKKWGPRKGGGMVQHLRRQPGDYTGALRKLPAKERALHVFAYQSLIWNRSVGLYLGRKLPAAKLTRTRYAGGELVWPDLAPDEPSPSLVETFPLLDDTVAPDDPDVRAAIDAALAEEGLTLERFKIEGVPGCFFKHHERLLRVRPERLVVGKAEPDDRRPGRLKVRLSFRLPPGAYATLVLLRLFGAQAREADRDRTRFRRPRGGAEGGARDAHEGEGEGEGDDEHDDGAHEEGVHEDLGERASDRATRAGRRAARPARRREADARGGDARTGDSPDGRPRGRKPKSHDWRDGEPSGPSGARTGDAPADRPRGRRPKPHDWRDGKPPGPPAVRTSRDSAARGRDAQPRGERAATARGPDALPRGEQDPRQPAAEGSAQPLERPSGKKLPRGAKPHERRGARRVKGKARGKARGKGKGKRKDKGGQPEREQT